MMPPISYVFANARSDEAARSSGSALAGCASTAMTGFFALLLSGCNAFDRPPNADDIYKVVAGMKEQPFNIAGVACKAAGSGAYECGFSATIVTGYLPANGGEMRPEYRVVQMSGRFAKAGDKWARADATGGPEAR